MNNVQVILNGVLDEERCKRALAGEDCWIGEVQILREGYIQLLNHPATGYRDFERPVALYFGRKIKIRELVPWLQLAMKGKVQHKFSRVLFSYVETVPGTMVPCSRDVQHQVLFINDVVAGYRSFFHWLLPDEHARVPWRKNVPESQTTFVEVFRLVLRRTFKTVFGSAPTLTDLCLLATLPRARFDAAGQVQLEVFRRIHPKSCWEPCSRQLPPELVERLGVFLDASETPNQSKKRPLSTTECDKSVRVRV
jgi:hypothetical protein